MFLLKKHTFNHLSTVLPGLVQLPCFFGSIEVVGSKALCKIQRHNLGNCRDVLQVPWLTFVYVIM